MFWRIPVNELLIVPAVLLLKFRQTKALFGRTTREMRAGCITRREAVKVGSLILLIGCVALPLWAVDGPATVVDITLDEVIHSISAGYVIEGIDHAEETGADAVLIRIYTPGGLLGDMRAIVNRITSSKVPVFVYVSPSGSRAASAGFFILMAADVAAMAPGTTTGAASPIMGTGQEEMAETLKKKVFEDSAAYLRSYTTKRDRNPEVAELAVTEAKAFTDEEALDAKLIDVIVGTAEELLSQFDGKTIKRFDGSEEVLSLSAPRMVAWEMTTRQRFLTRLSDPSILLILLVLGLLGLYVEFNNPGLIFPGVVGGICIVLALFAAQVLPVNYAGVMLILLALAFFVLEAMFASHGVLAVGGVVSMVLGALMLVDAPPGVPELSVRLDVAIATVIPFALITVFLLRSLIKSRGWHVSTGREDMVGAIGEVRQEIVTGQKGMVMVAGELWRAVASESIAQGQQVRVAGMKGLLLQVEPYTGGEGTVSAAGEE
jgi:membrane-bound serine protease (ClpP class)